MSDRTCGHLTTQERYPECQAAFYRAAVPASPPATGKHSTDPEMDAALRADAAYLEAMGADPGITLDEVPASPRADDCPECGPGCPGWTIQEGPKGEPEQSQCRTCFERPVASGTPKEVAYQSVSLDEARKR